MVSWLKRLFSNDIYTGQLTELQDLINKNRIETSLSKSYINELEGVYYRLSDAEARFRSCFDNSNIGMTLSSSSKQCGHFINVNKKFCSMVKMKKNDILSKCFTQIIHNDDLKQYYELMRLFADTNLTHKLFKQRYVDSVSETVYTIATISHIKPINGEPYFLHQIEGVTKDNYEKEEIDNDQSTW